MESISSNGFSRKDEWDRPTPLRETESETGNSEYHTGTASFTPSYTPKTVLSSRILKQMGLVPVDDGVTEESNTVRRPEILNRLLMYCSILRTFLIAARIFLVVKRMKNLIEISTSLKKEPFAKHQMQSMYS
jgi:hypothetical protein